MIRMTIEDVINADNPVITAGLSKIDGGYAHVINDDITVIYRKFSYTWVYDIIDNVFDDVIQSTCVYSTLSDARLASAIEVLSNNYSVNE